MNKKNTMWKVSGRFAFLFFISLMPARYMRAISQEPLQNTSLISATISVTYVGSWDIEAQNAMEHAVNIWEEVVYSPVPIEIEASWGPDFLGGPASVFGSYVQSYELPNPHAFYPEVLSNAIKGEDRTGNADFVVQFNNDFNNWYFGTDGQTPASDYDFVTVALKYIGRGLGLQSWMALCGPTDGCWGTDSNQENPLIFDTLVVNDSGQHLTDTVIFPNPSPALRNELTSDDIYFAGLKAIAVNGGIMPQLYAPESWQSIKYSLLLDDAVFPTGSINALMTHTLETGEVIHDPGPLAKAMLSDLGWPTAPQAPVLDSLPLQLLSVNTNHNNAIDLWHYVNDPDTLTAELVFRIVSTSPSQIGALLDNGRYISIHPEIDWTGSGQIIIEVEDPTGLIDSQSLNVFVVDQIFQNFLPSVIKP